MIKRILAFLVLVGSLVFAAQENIEQDVDSRVESINARKGLEISGTVRSASFNSYFESPNELPNRTEGNSNGTTTNKMPRHEISEFVQLDLNFKFRPWDIISANLQLRLGAGAQEYFAAAATTVSVPWMNIEGQLGDDFYWIVGDFRQSYSPLTLYMPGLDVMYEPLIFARKREMAQKEALLDGNQRNLQGFNLQFRPQLGETLGELRVEALGARLRRAGYLDASGAMGNILPNEGIAGATQAGRFDKFLFAGNLELLPLNKNLLIGGTYMVIADSKGTSKYYSCPSCGIDDFSKESLLNTSDSLPQKTSVVAGRVGADIAGLLGNSSLVANLTAEMAISNDKVYDAENVSLQEEGKATLMQMDLGYKDLAGIDIVLSTSFIRNDSSWFNNLAQTPSFFARRVLNTDKDIGCGNTANRPQGECNDITFNLSKYGAYSPLYSTFDALYFFTPKHSPMQVQLGPGAPGKGDQTQSYNISPYAKTSWNPSTLTRAELALLEELSDLNLQMALPGGFATSNRTGYQEVFTANWKGLAEVKALFANYEQLLPNLGAQVAKYTEFGGGAKIDILGILGFEKNPLELSGSYKTSAKEQQWDDFGLAEYTSDFTNFGLYYRFFRKFGLTFGYQQINSELNIPGAQAQVAQMQNLKVSIVPVVSATQKQWMAGLDYTVAKNAWLSINYGIIDVENTYKLKTDSYNYTYVKTADSYTYINTGTNMPIYSVVNAIDAEVDELKHKFSRNIIEATINVEF